MKFSKKFLIGLVGVLILLMIIFFPYMKAEILTAKYGEEFRGLETQTQMMDLADYHKVIQYSDSSAEVYYVHKNKGGCVIQFEKDDEQNWCITYWKMIWSHYGSANEFYWPYYK